MEFYSGVKLKWPKMDKWLNDKLYDKYVLSLVDMFFPIREFLIGHLSKVTPNKKYLKIPVLTDFDKYNEAEILQEPKYFFLEAQQIILRLSCLLLTLITS